jgi:hypothetical protein
MGITHPKNQINKADSFLLRHSGEAAWASNEKNRHVRNAPSQLQQF